MNIDDGNDTPLPTTPAQAFEQAKQGMALFGVDLFDWSPTRIIAADSMGLIWPPSPAAAAQIRENELYSGAMRDTIILCWLRSLPNASEQTLEACKAARPGASAAEREQYLEGWNVQRATRAPGEAYEAAVAWAAEKKITEKGAEFASAYKVAMATLFGLSLSAFEVEPVGGKPEPETGGPDPNV